MSSSFEKSVKGGTKVKLAPPKLKYVEHILLATQSGEAGVAEVFRTLTHRLRDSTWTVAFKALIIVHLMIKEGAPEVTLRYLAVAPRNRLALNSFTDVQTQGQNIRVYSEYLLSRASAYEKTKCDHARVREGHMKRLTVDKGLLRETEVVQEQIKALVKCDLLTNETENEISLTAFRLLTRDLLDLFNVENEAVMNVLSHYFEMSRPDAERAIRIYKIFCKQTEQVLHYLGVARQYEHATRLEIPKLKHAPTSLAASLQEYLDDPDFDINRRQYLAEQNAKASSGKVTFSKSTQPAVQPAPAVAATKTPFDDMKSGAKPTATQPAKGPAPDLIDFFGSIEQNQQTSETNPFLQQQQQQQPQMTGFQQPQLGQPQLGYQQAPAQAINPYGVNGAAPNPYQQQIQQQAPPAQPLQTQFTGAGFGGYGPQPDQQSLAAGQQYVSPVQQQSPAPIQPQATGTNPFRQSMMPTGGGGAGAAFGTPAFSQQAINRQSTNPFVKAPIQPIPENGPSPSLPQQQTSPFASQPPFQQAQPLQAQTTGANPFRHNTPSQPTPAMSPPGALQVQPTGSTNPFRQSQFVNQQTGSGWQHAPQGTMGGLEGLETLPVFPRPGAQPAPPPQQQQQSPWI